LSLSSKKYGFRIRDQEKKPIPDPDPSVRFKKTPDPGSGSATLNKQTKNVHKSIGMNQYPLTIPFLSKQFAKLSENWLPSWK
jgi:hypothetical protein